MENEHKGLMQTADQLALILANSHDLSEDERGAISMAIQLVRWAAKPAEQVEIVRHKQGIAFGAARFGDGFKD